MHKKASFCTGRARGLLHPLVLQSSKVSVLGTKGTHAPPTTSSTFPFLRKKPKPPGVPGQAGCSLAKERLRDPEGAERLPA